MECGLVAIRGASSSIHVRNPVREGTRWEVEVLLVLRLYVGRLRLLRMAALRRELAAVISSRHRPLSIGAHHWRSAEVIRVTIAIGHRRGELIVLRMLKKFDCAYAFGDSLEVQYSSRRLVHLWLCRGGLVAD